MFVLRTTESFLRQAWKFLDRHPGFEARLREVAEDLRNDPFGPRLGLHPLKGKLLGIYAVKLDRRWRITLTLDPERKEVTLLDIGGHDEVYR